MPHKKGHTWKDALGGKQINKAKLSIKKAWQSDKNPVQAQYNKQANIANSDKNQKSTAGGRIQKKLVKSGFSKTELRHKQEAHTKWKSDRAKMQKMRKENPEQYRKLKAEERKKKRKEAFRNPGMRK
mgnify:CR=1 FL=1